MNYDIFPSSAVYKTDILYLGGIPVPDLIKTYGSPLYILDRETIQQQYTRLTQAFGQTNHEIIYAGKACLTIGVAQLLHKLGASIDVVSLGELETALRAGVPPESIIMHGNNKSNDELDRAIHIGIRIMVDNEHELTRILDRSQASRPTPVLLRVNPDIQTETHAYIQTGQRTAKFGMALSVVIPLLQTLARDKRVRLLGLHSHLGSQLSDPEPYARMATALINMLIQVRDDIGVLPQLNLGGGFGVSYTESDAPVCVQPIIQGMIAAVSTACAAAKYSMPRLLIEPGRYLIARAGVTAYTIGDCKQAGDSAYRFIDGGMADNLRPLIYNAVHSLAPVIQSKQAEKRPVFIAGKFCESGDKLPVSYLLPPLNTGDAIIMCTTGAYTYSMASNYNRYCKPAMILVDSGHAYPLVHRETVDSIIQHDVYLDAL